MEDDSWKSQPKFISESTFAVACEKIREHCNYHKLNTATIIFHGGEPLLIGIKGLRRLGKIINEQLISKGIKVELGMQTNGLLFTEEIGDFFLEFNASLGVSIDGPPKVNDLKRVYHNGKGSSIKLEEKLKLITSEKYRQIFGGILCVINVDTNPLEIYEYFMRFNAPMVEFILPDDNYIRLPKGKNVNVESTEIGDWMVTVFDKWFYDDRKTNVRFLESIVKLIVGGNSGVESVGITPVDFIFIEANGDIEILDTLKSAYNGATQINHNVFANNFNEVALHKEVVSRQMGVDVLCATCRECEIVNICGGGYLPNRYSEENQFNNPSVYCSDLKKIITHINNAVKEEFTKNESVLSSSL